MDIRIDDHRLTSFLIASIMGIQNERIAPLPKKPGRPKNHTQYKHTDGDLTYLETTSYGINLRSHTDVRVMQGLENDRDEIWGMSIMSILNEDAIARVRLSRAEIRAFLVRARTNGFQRTLERIKAGEGAFSLFDIPKLQESVALPDRKLKSVLLYEERIDDNLDEFTGEENVFIRIPIEGDEKVPGYHTLFTAYYQGSRL